MDGAADGIAAERFAADHAVAVERPRTVPCCAVLAAAALSALYGAAADFAAKRIPAAQLLALAPVPAVLIVTGFRGYIAGGRAWLNAMLDRWNTVHEGGLALFSGTASERDIWAFALLAAVLIGLLTWYAVSRQSSRLAAFISVFWLLLSLFGEGFYPLALVLLTAGQLGLHMTSGSRAITRRAAAWCLEISAVLCACAVGLSGTEMPSVDRLRQSQKLMFKLISLCGMDAAFGWETSATDKALADTLPSVKPGEYERVNGLLEKTIYGGIALEPFEERALDLFVQRLWGRNVKKSWKMRLKLRYACLLAAK